MQFSFHIAQWHIVSTRFNTAEHWQAWANDALCPDTLPEIKPELHFLPALQRRRLSLSARLMFQAAHQVMGEQHCPVVFASHDGELNRSFELWQTLLREHSVSPTSFGLSVHNALVGQWSMLRGDTSENTALASQQDNWELAILEAVALLHDGAEQVLVVVADEPLSQNYTVSAERAPFPYAVAVRLERGSTWTLQRQVAHQNKGHYWGALTWAKQMLLQQKQFNNQYQTSIWQWQCIP